MKDLILNYTTVTPFLKSALSLLMQEKIFSPFRLVGGTNLSLRYGHRKSVDIDLFTDAEYGSLDFDLIEDYLKGKFKYYDCPDKSNIVGFGRSYYIGSSENECVKLDLMYTDSFISPVEVIDGIRFASDEDIIAMKLTAISNGGRKKDFWDLHLLMEKYSLGEMFNFYFKRHPWESTIEELKRKLIDFKNVDNDFEPDCLLNKDWDIIKLDLIDKVQEEDH